MKPATHEIDPDADTIITLKNAGVVFAPWDKKDAGRPLTTNLLAAPSSYLSSSATNNAPEKKETSSLFGGVQSDSVVPSAAVDKPEDSEPEGIRFKVSSRHLILASQWFKRALKKDGWSESSRDPKDGQFHITAADWDEEAFLILLNILHLRNRKVPRIVSLEMLAKIAVLIDYYECGEALEGFTEKWVGSLVAVTPMPLTYCRDLVLWIWVTWAFSSAAHFERATAVAVKESTEAFRDLGLPIPPKVSSTIDFKRCQAIEWVVGPLHALLEKYCSMEYSCPINKVASFECGSMQLGMLTKELNRMSLLSPRPKAPFAQLSFKGVCNLVGTIQSSSWTNKHQANHFNAGQSCNLKNTVTIPVTNAVAAVKGLNLQEIKQNILWEQMNVAGFLKKN